MYCVLCACLASVQQTTNMLSFVFLWFKDCGTGFLLTVAVLYLLPLNPDPEHSTVCFASVSIYRQSAVRSSGCFKHYIISFVVLYFYNLLLSVSHIISSSTDDSTDDGSMISSLSGHLVT